MLHGNYEGYKFDHVSINVSNYDEMVEFLNGACGFVPVSEWIWPGETQKHGFIDAGNGGLVELHELYEDIELKDIRMQHLCLKVPNAQEAYDRAIACGGKEERQPWEFILPCHPMCRRLICAYVKGPDDISIEFTQDLETFPYDELASKQK